MERSGERREGEDRAPFYRRLGAAGWSAIAAMIGALAAVLALVIPGGGNGPPSSTPSQPSPASTLVDKADAERVATEKASAKVEKSGILIPSGQFSAFCTLVSTSADLEVWDCSVSHSQCSGTVVLTFTQSSLANVKNDVFCKD